MNKLFFIIGILSSVLSAGDLPATHGMLMVGTHKIYAYHLPMFHNPHNYQAIFEIELNKSTMEIYLANKAQSPELLYTLVPQPLVLPDLAKKPQPIMATLFQGHFEQGGVPITRLVKVGFIKTILFVKLNPKTLFATNYQGFIFGNEMEKFMAHGISGAPDFDQIVEISANADLSPGSVPTSFAGVGNSPLVVPTALSNPNGGALQVTKQIYLEFEDLKP